MNPPNPATFHPLVWRIVSQVPYSVVSTYGQIASIIPPDEETDPKDHQRLCPKWVGQALNAISFSDIDGKPTQPGIPWWRIINAKGGISMPVGSAAAQEQHQRLEAEGIRFDPTNDTVNLSVFGWAGPDEAWVTTNGLIMPKPLNKPDKPHQMSLF